VPRVAAHYDQPFGNSSAVPAYLCACLAASEGVEKLLAGDGGDELFGGNSRYAKQKVFDLYWRLPSSLRGSVIEPLLASSNLTHIPLLCKVGSYVRQARVPMPQRTETYNLLSRFGASAVLTQDLLCSVDTTEPPDLQQRVFNDVRATLLVDRMLAYDWRFTLADNDLPKVIGTAQLAGIDVGFPLLDDDLMDFSLELGADDKVRGLRLRSFFKDALADFLPAEIIAKKKHGFGLPVGPWLLRDAAFRELARASLQGLVGRRLLQPAFVDDLFSARLGEHAGYFGEMIWVLMMLEQWLAASEKRPDHCFSDACLNDSG
jgi:asparagine synthase (glutamine-hydrolysing)